MYFHDHFNPNKKSLAEVKEIIRMIDIMCNVTSERSGNAIDGYQMIVMVLWKLDYNLDNVKFKDVHAIYHMQEQLFFKYPPVLYDNNTENVLLELTRRGATKSILSNTGFINGHTLTRLLNKLGILNYFSFTIYSDSVGMSKPNPVLYTYMKEKVKTMRIHDAVKENDIIHVGDNLFADIEGAKESGISAFQINSNNNSITDLL